MKRVLFFIFAFFLSIDFCAAFGAKDSKNIKDSQDDLPYSKFNYTVIPENPRPGEPVTIAATKDAVKAVLLAGGKRISSAVFFTVPAQNGKRSFLAAVLTIPSTAEPGIGVIRLEGEEGAICEILINIADREFESETLRLNSALTGLVTQPDPQKTAESKILGDILYTFGSDVYAEDQFILPVLTTRRTSHYGEKRINVYSSGRSSTAIHAGIDFGAPAGTEVFACAPGKVVMARSRIITGNTVIIEHLPGFYSLYYHMDKVETDEGSMVSAGTLIGRVGATGFATGPHLHWELRINGEHADPDAFTARPIIDKNAILSTIFK